MVDAEQSWVNLAIDSLTRQIQAIYNKNKAVVLNTYQCYLAQAHRNISLYIRNCTTTDTVLAIKQVRGAYVEQENEYSKIYQQPYPVCPSRNHTDIMYNSCMQLIIKTMLPNSVLTLATHNEPSVRYCLKLMKENKSELEERNVVINFAQLQGLSDDITYELAQLGMNSQKYIPFGKTKTLILYLVRRAQEAAGSLDSGGTLQIKAMWEELKNRYIYLWLLLFFGLGAAGIWKLRVLSAQAKAKELGQQKQRDEEQREKKLAKEKKKEEEKLAQEKERLKIEEEKKEKEKNDKDKLVKKNEESSVKEEKDKKRD